MGYYFYYPPENKIVVERYVDFLKKDFILQKESGRIIELQDEDNLPSENTREHPIEEEKIDPDRLCFKVKVEEHSLGDLDELANYKATLSDPEFEKWLVAMNVEMQSTYDNKVWRLVVLPPNAKVVKTKWIYKKKTNMDGKRYRMDNSKRGSIPMQVDLYLSKSQCATTSAEMKRMQNVPYASAAGSINMLDPEAKLRVNCYYDAGFKTDRDDTKSQTRYVFVLNGGAVIRKFIDELGVVPSNDYLIKMNYDNSVVIIIAKESRIQKGARHFKRKYHYVRECIETGKIDIVKVHTDDNLADPFTKS
nr:hypothetical protein [Tanacetum cinerariifolium]